MARRRWTHVLGDLSEEVGDDGSDVELSDGDQVSLGSSSLEGVESGSGGGEGSDELGDLGGSGDLVEASAGD